MKNRGEIEINKKNEIAKIIKKIKIKSLKNN